MQYLVVLQRSENFDPQVAKPFLEEGAQIARKLYSESKFREIYSRTDDKGVVLFAEANTEDEVRTMLAELPLVRENMLLARIYGLKPYRGFVG